jgi:hypothetical protein
MRHRRVHYLRLNEGIAQIMNSLNSGTVKAISPCAGL